MPPDNSETVEIPIQFATPDADLTVEQLDGWRAELLLPEAWDEVLSKFARSMNLAVALTSSSGGKLLGRCHNPQPVWSIARQPALDSTNEECLFCLKSSSPCTAQADAFRTGGVVQAHDQYGLAHVAVPLLLGGQQVGTLLAGQIFDRFPQPLPLQRAARIADVSSQLLWQAALRQVPISNATLLQYGNLLASLGDAFLRQRYAVILQRNLAQTDRRYRLMIEGAKERALFTVDGNGTITSWNPGAGRLLGYAASEVVGQNFSRFFAPEDILSGGPAAAIQSALHQDWFATGHYQVRRNGTRFYSESVIVSLNEGGTPEFGVLLHDVTERRNTEQALLQAQKLESIGVLAGGIAHDFNNLLTSIMGNVSLALTELRPGDGVRPLLETVERSSLKAAALIAQLLAYVGKGHFAISQFDLSKLVADTLPLIEASIPKMVRLDLNLPAGLPSMKADASQIHQIVMNLVINGAEAIDGSGGTLRVSTGVTRFGAAQDSGVDGVYVEVQDSGCGMDAATQQKIFDPFFTTKFTGRGLGLAAVSGIVRRFNGQLDVDSVPGKGTTFRIAFPGLAPLPAETATPPVTHASAVSLGTGTILVVDDDALVRGLAQAVFERHGYSVLIASNGKEAVQVFRDHADTISAVLLDLTMPVMGGGEAFQLMREIRPEIPVILSTGYGETAVREQFTSALAGVIDKPYTVSELIAKITAVLKLNKRASHSAGGGAA